MNLTTIALRNLRRRSGRVAFLVLGLAVGIATAVTLLTITRSATSDMERKLEEFGANILVLPKSSDLAMNYGGISLGGVTFDQQEIHEADLARIRAIPNHKNLAAVAPKLLGGVTVHGRQALLVGVEFASELQMKPWWRIFGKEPTAPDQLLLGSEAADALGVLPGERLQLKGEEFTVAGVLEQTGSQDDALLFVALPTAQRLLGKPGRITLVEVAALCAGCPISDMVSQIAAQLPGAKVSAIQQVVAGRVQALDQFKRFAYGVSLVVLFIGALIVFVTMLGSVSERRGEIGIFRAIGYRRRQIMGIFLTEAAMVSLLAGVLGYLAGIAVARLALPYIAQSASARLHFDPLLAAGSILLAVLLGLLATIYPARQASRLDPVAALRSL